MLPLRASRLPSSAFLQLISLTRRAAESWRRSNSFLLTQTGWLSTKVAEGLWATLSGFLADESCGQCPPCKLGTGELRDRFAALADGTARPGTLEEIAAWTTRVTDSNRCGLGGGQAVLAAGFVSAFGEELVLHLDGTCGRDRTEILPALVDYDEASGRFTRKAG